MSQRVFLLSMFFFYLEQYTRIVGYEVNSSYAFNIMLVVFMFISFLIHIVNSTEIKSDSKND